MRDELQKTLTELGLSGFEAAWVVQAVRNMEPSAMLSPDHFLNIGALEELAKYAPLEDRQRSPQNRRGPEPPLHPNCRSDIQPI